MKRSMDAASRGTFPDLPRCSASRRPAPQLMGKFLNSAVAGVFNKLEFRIVRPDGSVRWFRSRAFPVYDADGSLFAPSPGWQADITEPKLAKEAIAARASSGFRTFVDSCDRCVLPCSDDQLVVLDVNREACERPGATARDEAAWA